MVKKEIGRLILPTGEVALLDYHGVWRCSDKVVARYLNETFNPQEGSGLAVLLPFGHMAISQAAKQLKAKVRYSHTPELPNDLVV